MARPSEENTGEGMKTVFWKAVSSRPGKMSAQFWTKANKSNSIVIPVKSFEETDVRAAFEEITGAKHFVLKREY